MKDETKQKGAHQLPGKRDSRTRYQGPGAGIYTVKINVENGTVEDILYDSALAGNG